MVLEDIFNKNIDKTEYNCSKKDGIYEITKREVKIKVDTIKLDEETIKSLSSKDLKDIILNNKDLQNDRNFALKVLKNNWAFPLKNVFSNELLNDKSFIIDATKISSEFYWHLNNSIINSLEEDIDFKKTIYKIIYDNQLNDELYLTTPTGYTNNTYIYEQYCRKDLPEMKAFMEEAVKEYYEEFPLTEAGEKIEYAINSHKDENKSLSITTTKDENGDKVVALYSDIDSKYYYDEIEYYTLESVICKASEITEKEFRAVADKNNIRWERDSSDYGNYYYSSKLDTSGEHYMCDVGFSKENFDYFEHLEKAKAEEKEEREL